MQSIHEKTAALMPWYVTGTLPDDERRALETHLGECLPCRARLREEQRLCDLVGAQDDLPVGPAHGVAALLTRIGDDRRPAPRRLAPALAGSLAVIALLIAGALIAPSLLGPGADRAAPAFETLTGAGTPPGDAPSAAATTEADTPAEGDLIDIVFAAETSADEIERILDGFGGRIVAGPSELGRYTISVPPRTSTALDRLIETLGENPGIRFAGRNYIGSAASAGSTEDADP